MKVDDVYKVIYYFLVYPIVMYLLWKYKSSLFGFDDDIKVCGTFIINTGTETYKSPYHNCILMAGHSLTTRTAPPFIDSWTTPEY